MLQNKPHHIRKKIALAITGIVAAVLLVLLALGVGAKKEGEGAPDTGEKFKDFYDGAVGTTRSLFD